MSHRVSLVKPSPLQIRTSQLKKVLEKMTCPSVDHKSQNTCQSEKNLEGPLIYFKTSRRTVLVWTVVLK